MKSNEEILDDLRYYAFKHKTEIFKNEVVLPAMDEARREAVAEKDRVIAELNLALNEAEKKIKQLDTKPY